jgi:hypothetical protein
VWDGAQWKLDEEARDRADQERPRLEALQRIASECTWADAVIVPLQNAVDLDMATDAELARVKVEEAPRARAPCAGTGRIPQSD